MTTPNPFYKRVHDGHAVAIVQCSMEQVFRSFYHLSTFFLLQLFKKGLTDTQEITSFWQAIKSNVR